jgi:hypothetical protein
MNNTSHKENGMTKRQAYQKLELYGLTEGYLYQYETGGWNAASVDSSVGKNLRDHGMIDVDLNMKPKTFERVTIAHNDK